MRFFFFLSLLIFTTGCTIKPPTSEVTRRTDTRVDLALAYLKNGNFDRAAFHLQRAKAISPSNLRYQLTTAYYYELTGQHKKALALYNQLFKMNKTNPNVLNNFAQYQCRQNNFNAAETLFDMGIKHADGPFTGTINKNAGLCALQNNDEETAQRRLVTAHRYWPNDPEIISLLKRWNNAQSSTAGIASWPHSSF